MKPPASKRPGETDIVDSHAIPKVTVLIPVYNCQKYVAEAIESVLEQGFSDFELLLIDDGSTDGSRDILGSYADPRIRVILNETNLGIPRTLNKGLGLARGEYFALLDNDDFASPNRLELQVDFLERHEEYAAVGTWAVTTDEEGRTLGQIKRLFVAPDEVQSQLLFRCCLLHPSMTARTSVLRSHVYREDFVTCADFDLWVRVAKTHRIGSLPSILMHHREHADRATHRFSQRAKAEKLEIIANQLNDLGLTFDDADLERHFLLQRLKSARFIPDRAYLTWASAWLDRLQTANEHTLLYSERPFARVLARTWLRVCRRASRKLGWIAWLQFWRSPLGAAACFHWNQRLLSRPGSRFQLGTRS